MSTFVIKELNKGPKLRKAHEDYLLGMMTTPQLDQQCKTRVWHEAVTSD